MKPTAQPPGPGSCVSPAGTRTRGSVLIFVAIALVTCLAFSVLAIDIGLILMTRGQLQNAADAAALAGASALVSATQETATERAIAIAAENRAWLDGSLAPVEIEVADVNFPTAARCRVQTHRTRATGDALRTYFVGVLAPASDRLAQTTAVAEAEYYFLCGTDCLKPWSVPDRWSDTNQNGAYDYGEAYTDSNRNGRYDVGEPYTDTNRNGVRDPDEPYDPRSTGYLPPRDVGIRITLKIGQPQDTIVPGFFYAVDFPPLGGSQGSPQTGANQYRWNIANCSPYTIDVGDTLQVEPGNMRGPTRQGAQVLIDSDPGASWDGATKSVIGSAYGTSPRVIKIGFFDPRYTPKSGRNYVIVSKLGAFFIESVSSNSQVTGVFMGLGTQGEACGPGQPGFLTSLRLVE